jgi:hypothetical protein
MVARSTVELVVAPAILVFMLIGHPVVGKEGQGGRFTAKSENVKTLLTEEFTPGANQPICYRFNLLANNGGLVDGRDCWKLIFFPNDDFPPEAQHRIIVHVDKQHGWPRKATPVKSDAVVKIQQVGEASFILDAPAGVPLDMLPLVPSQEFRDGPATLKFQSTRAGKDYLLELTYAIDGKEKLRVRQRWTEGDDWWRYYEKYLDGKLSLRARAFDAPPLDDAFAEVKPPPAKVDPHPLTKDKRLYAMVQVLPKRPSVAHLLRRMKEATGLEMEVEPGLELHVPDLGYLSPGPKGFFAWQLMEHLAKIEIDNGRWENTSTGYRLSGVSTVPPGRVLETSDDQPPPKRRSFPWLPVAGGCFALAVIGAALIVRKRFRKAGSQQ